MGPLLGGRDMASLRDCHLLERIGATGSRLRNRLYTLGGTGAIRDKVTATQTLPTRGNADVAIPCVGRAQGFNVRHTFTPSCSGI